MKLENRHEELMQMTTDKISFIKTSDKETADTLILQGFDFLYQRNGFYVFVCNPSAYSKYSLNNNCLITDTLVL